MFAPRDEGSGSSDPRLARLYEPHVEPLTRLISVIRDRAGGQTVPNVDPNDGGINAPALFLPRAPVQRQLGLTSYPETILTPQQGT
jgi:hypothetical protein